MKHLLQVDLSKNTIWIISIYLLFASCKEDKPELNGKWIGKSIGSCPQHMLSNGINAILYEFSKDGECKLSFEGNNGAYDAIFYYPDSKYELTADSLILIFTDKVSLLLIFTDKVYSRLAFKYEIKDKNNIVLSRSLANQHNPGSNCNSVMALTRKDN